MGRDARAGIKEYEGGLGDKGTETKGKGRERETTGGDEKENVRGTAERYNNKY